MRTTATAVVTGPPLMGLQVVGIKGWTSAETSTLYVLVKQPPTCAANFGGTGPITIADLPIVALTRISSLLGDVGGSAPGIQGSIGTRTLYLSVLRGRRD